MTIDIDSALAATAQLYRPTTKTDVIANRINPLNRDDIIGTKASGMTICHTPGGAEASTAMLTQYFGAATTNGKFVSSGGTSSRGEIKLRPNSSYLIVVTSRANSNALSINLDWYEHTDKSN